MSFKGYRVIDGGTISKYGSIRLLGVNAAEGTSGAAYWSEALVSFAGGDFTAEVTPQGRILVQDRAGNGVSVIDSAEFFTVRSRPATIGKGGWIVDGDKVNLHTLAALLLADEGKDPGPEHYDNSRFVKVSAEFEGQKVFEAHLFPAFGNGADSFKVFSLDGKEIPSVVSSPLAFSKWGKETPSPE